MRFSYKFIFNNSLMVADSGLRVKQNISYIAVLCYIYKTATPKPEDE